METVKRPTFARLHVCTAACPHVTPLPLYPSPLRFHSLASIPHVPSCRGHDIAITFCPIWAPIPYYFFFFYGIRRRARLYAIDKTREPRRETENAMGRGRARAKGGSLETCGRADVRAWERGSHIMARLLHYIPTGPRYSHTHRRRT